jgi:hypothetical protein
MGLNGGDSEEDEGSMDGCLEMEMELVLVLRSQSVAARSWGNVVSMG